VDGIARALAVALAVGTAALASVPSPARAEPLATLHVRTFSMSADPTSLRVGDTVRLTIVARVDESVLELDNVTLPDLSGFDVLGDERRCTSGTGGTACSETLTLSPTVGGERTIGPAIMDAVDARNGRPSRFATGTVTLHIAGSPPASAVSSRLVGLVGDLARAIAIFALVTFAAWVLLWGFRRRTPPAAIAPPPPPEAPPDDPAARYTSLVAALAEEPTRERALAVRAALRERVGARENETLADLRARRAGGNGATTLAALGAVERAAFCEDERVAAAVGEALPFLKH
jgi:ABC-type amino acid transport substrate-binding protein